MRTHMNSGGINFLEDMSGPFYVHNGDSPGLILVSDLLIGSNYNNWSLSMLTALTVKNKVGFIDGSTPKPDTLDPTYNYWIRCNSMVVSWLRNSVDPEIRSSLQYLESAAQIWKDLHQRFSHGNAAARIYRLKQQLTSLKQGSMDIHSYHTKFQACWDELQDFQPIRECSKCGNAKSLSNFQQQECVIQFLMGLNDSYSELRSQLISEDPLPPLRKVFSLVLQEERHRIQSFSAEHIMEKGQTTVKMMEKKSYKFVVRNYSAYEGIGMGNWIQSRPFVVGGHKFRLHLYPEGKDLSSHYGDLVSLFIKNESATNVQLVAALEVLDRRGIGVHAGYSCFDDRKVYKHVVTIESGKRYGEIDFHIESGEYVREDSIIIRATLGVFIDQPSKVSPPLERCIVFQVGDRRYYADEAVITTRCPALLSFSQSQSQSDFIVISDVKTNVFEAVLWFIYNQVVHKRDIEAIANSNFFALEILAAADRFELNGLRRQCESYISYGEVVELYYLYESVFKELWSYGCRLWSEMKEVISQEMNEA